MFVFGGVNVFAQLVGGFPKRLAFLKNVI